MRPNVDKHAVAGEQPRTAVIEIHFERFRRHKAPELPRSMLN
jgi:hypothetical protein